jgi:hypothetical protein
MLLLLSLASATWMGADAQSCLRFDEAKLAVGLAKAEQLAAGAPAGKVNCSADLTPMMQPCFQATQSWCWATSISELSFYYNASSRAADCSATECSVVSLDLQQQCCPKGSSAKCDFHGAKDTDEIAAVANKFIPGHAFGAVDEPLAEADLAAVLTAGSPLVIAMKWNSGSGGHAMVLGGCRQGTWGAEYAVHDPESRSWSWFTYQLVLKYSMMTWVGAVYDGAAAAA